MNLSKQLEHIGLFFTSASRIDDSKLQNALMTLAYDYLDQIIDRSVPGETDIRIEHNGRRQWLSVVVDDDGQVRIQSYDSHFV